MLSISHANARHLVGLVACQAWRVMPSSLFIHLSIHPSIHPPIHPFVHPPVHLSRRVRRVRGALHTRSTLCGRQQQSAAGNRAGVPPHPPPRPPPYLPLRPPRRLLPAMTAERSYSRSGRRGLSCGWRSNASSGSSRLATLCWWGSPCGIRRSGAPSRCAAIKL